MHLPCLIHTGRLLIRSCKYRGCLGLRGRTMADAVAQNDVIAPENIPKDEVNSVQTHGVMECPPEDEKADGSSSKKLIIDPMEEYPKLQVAKKKVKVALLLAYCGSGYHGMQRNIYEKSIEGEVLSALLKAGLINQDNFTAPQMIQFQRSSRTDKGVSATGQVVSLRLPGYAINKDTPWKINAHLPTGIKVLGLKRTRIRFNANTWNDGKTYSYTLPTFAFAPITELTSEDYRITDDVLERLNSVLKSFSGTHNFHNFTSRQKPDSPKVVRNLMKFKCGKPVVEDGLELVEITIKGKGFLFHQIRKMIGFTIVVMKDLTSRNMLKIALSDENVDVPLAPALGLTLERVYFNEYNKDVAERAQYHTLDWDYLKESIENFKRTHIRPVIVATEKQEKSMLLWVSNLYLYTHDIMPETRSRTRSQFGVAWTEIMNKQKMDEQAEAPTT